MGVIPCEGPFRSCPRREGRPGTAIPGGPFLRALRTTSCSVPVAGGRDGVGAKSDAVQLQGSRGAAGCQAEWGQRWPGNASVIAGPDPASNAASVAAVAVAAIAAVATPLINAHVPAAVAAELAVAAVAMSWGPRRRAAVPETALARAHGGSASAGEEAAKTPPASVMTPSATSKGLRNIE